MSRCRQTASLRGAASFLLSILLIQAALQEVEAQPKPLPPPTADSLTSREQFTNKTIDQLITGALGGIGPAASKILSPGDNILAELDLYLTQNQFVNLYEPPSSHESGDVTLRHRATRRKRKAIRDPVLRWTNNEIPYTFARGHFTAQEMYLIKQAMTEWERYTCLSFRPADERDRNVLHFQNGEGCNSQLGMVGGVQLLNLDQRGCRFMGLYLHEIGHAVGLVHEHQRPNRDDYITILYHNVAPHMRIWFNKYAPAKINNFMNRVQYEYSSVMHYGITAFAQDGSSQTIRALQQDREKEIGRVYLKQLSYSDVQVVNYMYKCAAPCPASVKCRDGGYVDENCRCVCPDGTHDCTEGAAQPASDCVNEERDWQCAVWAHQGECDRNEPFMSAKCRKACRLCDSEKQQEGECRDEYPEAKCRKWQGLGDCVANPSWMERHCRKTCKACPGDSTASRPEIACEDQHSDSAECQRWALAGECKINLVWMSKNCARSCQTCDKTDVTDPETDNAMVCRDQYDTKSCASWADMGECDKNPTWMIPNCRKSCDKCDNKEEKECKDLHNSQQCQGWASDGECAKNPSWMKENCRLSCKACKPGSTDGSTTVSTGVTDSTGVTGRTRATVRTTTVSTNTGTTGTSGGDCRNDHNEVECDIWAKFSHCDINPAWMKKHCRRSCKVCTDSDSDSGTDSATDGQRCTDKYFDPEQCRLWAEDGQCAKNPSWMTLHCRRACRVCSSTPEATTPRTTTRSSRTTPGPSNTTPSSTGTEGSEDCENLYFDSAQCQDWADFGECDNNPSWMLVHCQKSCKACPVEDSRVTGLIGTDSSTVCPTCGSSASAIASTSCLVLLGLLAALLDF